MICSKQKPQCLNHRKYYLSRQLQLLQNKFSYFGINWITGLALLSYFIPFDGVLPLWRLLLQFLMMPATTHIYLSQSSADGWTQCFPPGSTHSPLWGQTALHVYYRLHQGAFPLCWSGQQFSFHPFLHVAYLQNIFQILFRSCFLKTVFHPLRGTVLSSRPLM